MIKRLQKMRETHTLASLAEKLEISEGMLSMILSGRRGISMKLARRLCDLWGVSLMIGSILIYNGEGSGIHNE